MPELPPTSGDAGLRLATREHPAMRGSDAEEHVGVRVRGLNHTYGKGELAKQVLFDNQLELTRGEIVIMTGPSGSGKTTLLTLIGGLRTVQEGSIEVMGRELRGLSPTQLGEVRRDIGFIFQAHNLFASLSSMQNVRMALELKSSTRAEMDARAEALLTALGLSHRMHYKPGSLSGGQRQRVAIARALANRPKLILADEPTAALDKQSGRDVVDLLRRISREERTTILIVTHDNRILDVADRIVNMVDGRVISDVVVSVAAVICEFLRRCPLFAALTPSTLSQVADKMTLEKFPSGATIIRQGDPGDKFYLIRSGRARVSTLDGTARIVAGSGAPARDASGGRILATLEEGDFFGEAALLSGEPRNASVLALEDVELYVLGKADFQAVIEASASFKEQLLKVLFERQ
jgi:putative ABC transport system ATP-binding protein